MISSIYSKLLSYVYSILYKNRIRKIKNELELKNIEHNRLDLFEMMQTLNIYVDNIDLLIDVGANEGEFARTFCTLKNIKQAILIEPNKNLNSKIKANSREMSSVLIINKALSNKNKECFYYYHNDSQMNSLIESDIEKLKFEFNDYETTKEKLFTSTLDFEIENSNIIFKEKKIFLKIDTQGNEIDILQGAGNTLLNTNYVLIEYMVNSPYNRINHLEDIINFLSKFNFKCIGPIYMKKRKNYEIGATNFLFAKM